MKWNHWLNFFLTSSIRHRLLYVTYYIFKHIVIVNSARKSVFLIIDISLFCLLKYDNVSISFSFTFVQHRIQTYFQRRALTISYFGNSALYSCLYHAGTPPSNVMQCHTTSTVFCRREFKEIKGVFDLPLRNLNLD